VRGTGRREAGKRQAPWAAGCTHPNRTLKSTPIVDCRSWSNVPSVKRSSSEDFPTAVSPTSKSFKRKSYSVLASDIVVSGKYKIVIKITYLLGKKLPLFFLLKNPTLTA
jgi:hypothetical protein